jgi:nucleotide-binding universal stress UspA family protein
MEAKSESGPVMLALSTFRKSEEAVTQALEKAAETGRLEIVFVVDQNLARYLVGTESGISIDLQEKCEEDMLLEHEKEAKTYISEIVKKAKEKGIQVSSIIMRGRFALVCLDVVKKSKPSVIFTTRSKRPAWVKKFFGAPVDQLIKEAGCPVVEA